MDTYTSLRAALDAIPIIDDHSHVLHHNIEPPLWTGPYRILPLTRVLADKVESGLYSYDLALEIAHDIMHRTAESLYNIQEETT